MTEKITVSKETAFSYFYTSFVENTFRIFYNRDLYNCKRFIDIISSYELVLSNSSDDNLDSMHLRLFMNRRSTN